MNFKSTKMLSLGGVGGYTPSSPSFTGYLPTYTSVDSIRMRKFVGVRARTYMRVHEKLMVAFPTCDSDVASIALRRRFDGAPTSLRWRSDAALMALRCRFDGAAMLALRHRSDGAAS